MATVNFTEGTDNIQSRIQKEDNTNTDILKLFNLEPSTSISVGDTVNYYDSSSTLIFSGYVQNLKTFNGSKEAEVYDLGAELLYRTLNEIITSTSPEGIIEYVITNFTSLTYVSTISSGVTIDIYPARNKRAWDIVTEMSELLLANFFVDKNGNFKLEVEGDTISTKNISTNNASLVGAWDEDKKNLVNSCTIEGDRQVFEKSESFAGPTTSVTLAEIPIDVYVTVGGTEKAGYVPGEGSGDYYVERETKQVNFDASSSTIVVNYTYSIPISVRRRNKASITLYGQHDKTFNKNYIKTREEARKYCEYIISLYSNHLQSSKWIMLSNVDYNDFESFLPNNLINVNDNLNNISGNYIIRKVTREYPGSLVIEVGSRQDDIFFWQKEVQQRIKQLESKDDNSTIINEDEQVIENAQVRLSNTVTVYSRTIPANVIYFGKNRNWDDASNPQGLYKWSDANNWGPDPYNDPGNSWQEVI